MIVYLQPEQDDGTVEPSQPGDHRIQLLQLFTASGIIVRRKIDYYLSDGDAELVSRLMGQLSDEGSYTLPDELLSKICLLYTSR